MSGEINKERERERHEISRGKRTGTMVLALRTNNLQLLRKIPCVISFSLFLRFNRYIYRGDNKTVRGYVQDIVSVAAHTCDRWIALAGIFDPPRFPGTRSTHAKFPRPACSARTARRDSTRYRLTFQSNDKRFEKTGFEISAEIDILHRSDDTASEIMQYMWHPNVTHYLHFFLENI